MPDHDAPAPRAGILLVNLGTPDAPTPGAIRRFLAEFLHDRRVVELSRWLWCPILHFFILPFRPYRLAEAYAKIWTPQGSPLLVVSQRQTAALAAALPGLRIELAMRYGQPSIAAGLAELAAAGVRRMLILPLYPQYSATTTASIYDAVAAAKKSLRNLPELRFVRDYHDDPGYIAALATSVRRHWQTHGRGQRLLISFHSIPQRYVDLGDPYRDECERSAALLAAELQLAEGEWTISYQSRLGRAPWLQPYTDVVLRQWAEQKLGDIDVIAPGFSADCLETLEEIRIRYMELYRPGGNLRYVPALNDDPEHIQALAGLARRQLQGWT